MTASHVAHRIGHVSLHHDPAMAAMALAEAEKERHRQREKLFVRHAYYYAVGRLLLATLFLVGAVAKIVLFPETRRAMDLLGLASPTLLLSVAVTVEFVAGSLLALGLWVRRSAGFLIAYVAAVTVLMHGDISVAMNRAAAITNLALAGGLLLLVAHGAGALSLDRVFERRAAKLASGKV